MIVKRVLLRNPQVSSFSRLGEYITHSQGKHERVKHIRITNCHSDNAADAMQEVEAIQAINRRTKMDKTYHLLVSFREGERPAPAIIEAIEDQMCAEIGYGEHQRISAIHSDTDHLHLHIAINKIHPKKYTAHEPYYDMRKLNAVAEKLEVKYNLEPDNHKPRQTASQARAQDMEKAAGIESLIGWVKRGCLNELLAAKSWPELHQTLAKNGLQIALRGNGFIISDGKGHIAKASSIDRQLSKGALEKRLGVYCARDGQPISPAKAYAPKPMPSKINTQQLWQSYLKEQEELKQFQSREFKQLSASKKQQIEVAKASSKMNRVGIKLVKGRFAKNVLYQSSFQNQQRKIQRINQEYEQKYLTIYGKNKRLSWHDWLKAKAQAGNTDALEVLRNRYERAVKPGHENMMTGEPGNHLPAVPKNKIETVTRKGTIHYQLPKTVLRDDGKKLWVAHDSSPEAIQQALLIAVKKFGPKLEINGSAAFKNAVITAAANSAMRIIFADPNMEAKRITLIEENIANYRNVSEQKEQRLLKTLFRSR